MKSNKWFKLIGAAVGLMILGFAVPSGQTATTLTLTAVVQNQQCQAGNMVNVTLTIDITPRHPQGVQFSGTSTMMGSLIPRSVPIPRSGTSILTKQTSPRWRERSKAAAMGPIRLPSPRCVAGVN